MIKIFYCIFTLLLCNIIYAQQKELLSPNGEIKVVIKTKGGLTYTVSYKNQPLLLSSAMDMLFSDGNRLSSNTSIKKIKFNTVNAFIESPVPEKRKIIPDIYNELVIDFKNSSGLIIRAYNDGVAYRFSTHLKDSLTIKNEIASFNFAGNYMVYYPEVQKRTDADSFHTSFEEPYQFKSLDSISSSVLCFTPVLIVPANGPKVLITESDLEDYPGMFLRGSNGRLLQGCFAPYPAEEKITNEEYPESVVIKRANYIAHTKGTRDYPWRVIVIAAQDKELPSNDIVYRLASPSRLKDVSWIQPGKGTDEWIIGINLFNIPFKAGINTATYKYYIDFAKRFGFDRIMMDAGWSDYKDLFKINSALNMDELAAYAKSKGIRLSMWTLALTLDRQLDSALQQFKKWGVNFIMTDFIDRDDQKMVSFYKRIAEACAKYQIMIMYHGAFKPAGFGRTYPNAITRESVLGSEYNIWSDKANPKHDLLLPFIRMVAGPMDYEPGLLDNATQKTFRPVGNDKVMSQGTRCHQLAMFVVYDNPMQFFSGNPSQGYMEPAFMELLGTIPTTWDETTIVDGKAGEYIITARKKGNDWFIGAITDWTTRTINIALNFLEDGNYEATICEDGVNADRYASDYRITNSSLKKDDRLIIKMASGGGFMVRLRKK